MLGRKGDFHVKIAMEVPSGGRVLARGLPPAFGTTLDPRY